MSIYDTILVAAYVDILLMELEHYYAEFWEIVCKISLIQSQQTISKLLTRLKSIQY